MGMMGAIKLNPFDARLVLIPQEHVAEVWPLGVDYLKSAERHHSLQSVEEWLGDCLNGRAQLWFVWSDVDTCEGAGITSLVESPAGRLCVINAFGAKRGNDDMLATVEAWAKAQGCAAVRVYGRIGWMDRLKGYKPLGVILNKGLANG